MTLWLLAIGLVSLLGQVVLLRELNVAFFGSDLIYILALGLWLLWVALGAALGAAIGRRSRVHDETRVRLLLLLLGWVLPASVVLTRGSRRILGAVPGAYLSFPMQILAMGLILLPVGLALGLLFRLAAQLHVARRGTLAGAYGIESAGGVVGGLLATLLSSLGVQNFSAAIVCGLCSMAAACHPWKRGKPRWLVAAAAATAVFLALGLGFGTDLDRLSTVWNHPALLETRDSPYGRVTLESAAGQVSVFENDALAYESQETGAEEFVHLAALQHPAPRSVLVLGGGAEGLLHEVSKHAPFSIDYVELDAVLLDLLARHLPLDLRQSLTAAHIHTTIADPRRFLDGGRSYDLILVGMPEPASGQTNRFFTRDFFAQCARRLSGGGVLALRLRSAENVWTPAIAQRAASIHRALGEVFPDVVVLPGVTNIIVASREPLPRDPEILSARLEARRIQSRLVSPAYIRYLYTNDRFAEIALRLERTRAPANTDTRPICYSYTLLLWLSRFFPAITWMELPDPQVSSLARSPWSWLALLAVAATLLLARRSDAWRRAGLVAAAGVQGVVLETALILNYQITRGVLFRDLGLLLTLFMAGLALGSWALATLARRAGASGGSWPGRSTGLWLLALLAGSSALAGWTIEAGWVRGIVSTGAMLLASGGLVAAVFAYASLNGRPDPTTAVWRLYAADLLGGSFGTIVASLFLVPLAGLAGTAFSVVLLAILAGLLV